MKSAGPVRLVFVLFVVITWTSALPAKETTTRRPPQPPIGDTIKQLTSQLMNISSDITLDTRTPPKVKQQLKKSQHNKEKTENSHPGVAVPMEESDLILEESTKKFSFYKIENKPTTDGGGLSTWVLLNSQTVSPSYSTTKPPRKPVIKQKLEENKNVTLDESEIFNKITKPLFKKRPSSTTTKKPPTTTLKATTVSEKEYKFTKIKASVLTNAINNKNKTEPKSVNKKSNENTTPISNKLQNASTVKPNQKLSTTISINDNELIPSIEAKDDEIELVATTQSSKKPRRPTTTTKRKKNKKRRRPSTDKSDTISNSTNIATKIKEKPISTQIYNYLSREIIPTVGVGLVGLMVTAGLASYFLYPFGIARRSYEVDRKDKEETYYYNDEYAPGGIAEEEAIGKVIAGMPANNYQGYRSPSSRDVYSNLQNKQNGYGFRKSSQSSSDAIYLTPSKKNGEEDNFYYRNHKPDYYNLHKNNYDQDIIEHSQETGYTVDDKQFVVGSVPKDEQDVTPAVVPEHGPRKLPEVRTKEGSEGLSEIVAEHAPRSLPEIFTKHGSSYVKSRKRRSALELENEIDANINEDNEKAESSISTQEITAEEANTNLTTTNSKFQSILNSLKTYFEEKLRVGLTFLEVTTRAISKYITEVRSRFLNESGNDMQSKEQPRVNN